MLRLVGSIFGVCSVLVLLSGMQLVLVYGGSHEPTAFLYALLWAAADWYPWVLLAPFVLWMAERFPLSGSDTKRHVGLHILGALATFALYLLLNFSLQGLAFVLDEKPVNVGSLLGAIFVAKFMVVFVVYGAIVAGRLAIDYRHRYRERALKASQLEKGLAEARLRSLEMQLHPHFLFNTLNAISTLMRRDVESADRMIARLSALLRYTLEAGDVQMVTLAEEVNILQKYTEIEAVRFGDRLNITLDVPKTLEKAYVPILLLQPIVENAIRHGVAPRLGPGQVAIQACRRGDMLHIEVVDDGVGLPEGWSFDSPGMGVGLSNTRERLGWHFGNEARLMVKGRRGPGVRVTLTLPFRSMSNAHSNTHS